MEVLPPPPAPLSTATDIARNPHHPWREFNARRERQRQRQRMGEREREEGKRGERERETGGVEGRYGTGQRTMGDPHTTTKLPTHKQAIPRTNTKTRGKEMRRESCTLLQGRRGKDSTGKQRGDKAFDKRWSALLGSKKWYTREKFSSSPSSWMIDLPPGEGTREHTHPGDPRATGHSVPHTRMLCPR